MGDVLVDSSTPYHMDIGVSPVPTMFCRAGSHVMLSHQRMRLRARVAIWVAEQAHLNAHLFFDDHFGTNDFVVQNLASQVR